MFKKLKRWFWDHHMYYYMLRDAEEMTCEMEGETYIGHFRFTINHFWMIFKGFAGYHLICKRKGHNWIVESHCGPDTGYETFDCKRCGLSNEVTFY